MVSGCQPCAVDKCVEAAHDRAEREASVGRVVGGCGRSLRRDRVIGAQDGHSPDAECHSKRDGDSHGNSDARRRRMNQ